MVVAVPTSEAMPPSACDTLRAWLLSALVVHAAVAGNPDAKRLYDDLLSNYNKLVRPVVNTSDVLRVCIKLKLSQLIDVVGLCFLTTCLFLRAPFVCDDVYAARQTFRRSSEACKRFIGEFAGR